MLQSRYTGDKQPEQSFPRALLFPAAGLVIPLRGRLARKFDLQNLALTEIQCLCDFTLAL